jgi:hypothetical protein
MSCMEWKRLRQRTMKIKEKIAEVKEKNAAKVQELFKMQNDHPAEVIALICCFQIQNTDFCSQYMTLVVLQRMFLSSMGKQQITTHQKFCRE